MIFYMLFFLNSWLESDTLKYCFAGKFKMPNCIKQLRKHLEWRNNPKVQNLSDDGLELLVFYLKKFIEFNLN